jgi:hypothetical protein
LDHMNKRKAIDKRDIFLLARDLTESSLNNPPLESAIVQMPHHTRSESEEGMGVFIKQPPRFFIKPIFFSLFSFYFYF